MKVAIITEGFQGTGYGHLTRCLSIYQAFEEKGITPLYIANCDEEGKKFISEVNLLQLNWIENEDELLKQINNFDIAIIDSYLAPRETYEKIYKSVKKAAYIDDYIRIDYPPGIIINGTIGAENLHYKKDDKHQYLLGIDYMPLRKEFWDIELSNRQNEEIKNILIILGSQDIKELTFPILNFSFKRYPNFNYHIVKNKNKTNKDAIKNYGSNVFFYSELNAQQILELMLRCDLAVSAAGQTTYELARIGLPTIGIGIIENQKYNLKGWVEMGFLKKEFWYYQDDLFEQICNSIKEIIGGINNNSKAYIDGQGARRIIKYLVNEDSIIN